MSAHPQREAPTVGRWTRLVLGAQVAASVLFAAVAAWLCTWLAARPALHLRLDWTAAGENTLDPALSDLIAKLPEAVRVETFFQVLPAPLDVVSSEVIARTRRALLTIEQGSQGRLRAIHHDVVNVVETRTRMAELGVTDANVLVVSAGESDHVLRLYRDIAQIDFGQGDGSVRVPPSVAAFRAEEALALALKRVSLGEKTTVLFSAGHGERDLASLGERDLSSFARALSADGCDVGVWSGASEARVPEGCSVLAIIDPSEPFLESELAALRAWLAQGGRLLAVPGTRVRGFDGPGTLTAFLREWGIEAQSGYVARFLRLPNGELAEGDPRCAELIIPAEGLEPRHPITEGLARGRRQLVFPLARYLRRGRVAPDALLLELVRAPRDSWRDLTLNDGTQAWRFDQGLEENGALPIALALSWRVGEPGDDGERRSARVVALGSADALANARFALNSDFALNAVNWLAARDWRLSISPRTVEAKRIDLAGSTLTWMNRLCVYLLPGLCALAGLVLYWRRRR